MDHIKAYVLFDETLELRDSNCREGKVIHLKHVPVTLIWIEELGYFHLFIVCQVFGVKISFALILSAATKHTHFSYID